MSVRRLTDADKLAIAELYRQQGETALTIAERYGVSNTTIGRILKAAMTGEEYDQLVQKKRYARGSEAPEILTPEPAIAAVVLPEVAPAVVIPVRAFSKKVIAESPPIDKASLERAPIERVAVRLPDPQSLRRDEQPEQPQVEILPILNKSNPAAPRKRVIGAPVRFEDPASEPMIMAPREMMAPTGVPALDAVIEDIQADLPYSELEVEDELDDLGDELEDDLDGDESDEDSIGDLTGLSSHHLLRVLPLADATLPRVCYIVIDKSCELIALPLNEFGDLGQLPSSEAEQCTLPVFDNQRVARRFSNVRTQRVIKIPDSNILRKTSHHLTAKGITRMLIDGQIYSLL